MLEAGLLNSGFGDEVFSGRGFLVSMFGGESRDPRRVRDALLEKIEKAKRDGFSEDDFLSAKNAMYGRMLRGLNDVENAATALLTSEMAGVELFATIELLASITLADVEKRLASFDPERFALSVILPREGEYASLDK